MQLHIGAGGIGKTRLLLETCQRLNKTGQWQAGFLNANADGAEIKRLIAEFLSKNNALFIAIDYTETRRDQLVVVLDSAQKYSPCRVRVALIARSSGDWFERLATDYPRCEKIFAGSACSGPYSLPALHQELTDREQAYTATLVAYAERLGFSDFNRQSTLTPNLATEHFANPLYLQMAALLALHGESADTANGLTDALLEACELGDEVDLRVEGKALVIEALKTYRAGWFDSYQPEAADEDALAALPVDEISEEWEW